MLTTDPTKDYHIGYEKGYAQAKYGFQCVFACVTNLANQSRVIEYWLGCSGLTEGVKADPVDLDDLDYARGYMDGYGRANDES